MYFEDTKVINIFCYMCVCFIFQIIYGGLPDENPAQEEEILSRRTRGRKINYQEVIASDSEEVV